LQLGCQAVAGGKSEKDCFVRRGARYWHRVTPGGESLRIGRGNKKAEGGGQKLENNTGAEAWRSRVLAKLSYLADIMTISFVVLYKEGKRGDIQVC